jgi:sulfide:quinone oxidoreductase
MQRSQRHRHRVVIAGGGVAGLETLLALRRLAEERVEIQLVAPERDFVYKPLATAEPFGLGRARRFDLAAIAADHGAGYVPDGIVSVEPERRVAITRGSEELPYDALVIATGARAREALPGALTFWGVGDSRTLDKLLGDLENRSIREVVFANHGGPGWPLPLYELALLTAANLDDSWIEEAGITIVTPEPSPLAMFGAAASDSVAKLLDERGVGFLAGVYPAVIETGHVRLVPSARVAADCVVSLPRAEGPRLPGVPHDDQGFVPVDVGGRVPGLADVYAAGDVTVSPIKQGGLAAQQGDAVAQSLAEWAGAPVVAQHFRPVLRGLLLTGAEPRFMRSEVSRGRGESSMVARHALWWPPGKIAGRHLAPYLASLVTDDLHPPAPHGQSVVEVEVELAQASETGRSCAAA